MKIPVPVSSRRRPEEGFASVAFLRATMLSMLTDIEARSANRVNLTSRTHLGRLVLLRTIAIIGVLVAMLIATKVFKFDLPWSEMAISVGCLGLVSGLTWFRLRKPWPVTDQEMFIQLFVDVLGIGAVVYLSGGSTNPFISLLLLPLILTATLLPSRFSWYMAALTIACYTVLLYWYVPLFGGTGESADIVEHNHDQATSFRLHVIGMWFNFVVSAGLIATVAVRMMESIRARDRLLASVREEALRNERIIALGAMAAGAAHELGTPLSTIAVISQDLQLDYGGDPKLAENLKIMRTQVDQCKRILSELLASTGTARAESGMVLPFDKHMRRILDKWSLVRPHINLKPQFLGEQAAPAVLLDQTIDQALMNLLNNAADVSPESVEVDFEWNIEQATITIRDHGPGLSPDALKKVGKAFFTTKGPAQGIGIGLFLANATIERFKGEVHWFNGPGGGAVIKVNLPLTANNSSHPEAFETAR